MIALTAFVGEVKRIKVTLNTPPTFMRAIVSYPGSSKTTVHAWPGPAWETVSSTVYNFILVCSKPGPVIGGIEAGQPIQYDEFDVIVKARRVAVT